MRDPKFNKIIYLTFLIFLLGILTACTGAAGSSVQSEGRLRTVATTTIVGDVVRQVAGQQVIVDVLLPVGADPHAFEPRPQDVAAITDADLIFASGVGLEEFLGPLLQNAGAADKVVEVSNGIALLPFEGDVHDGTSTGNLDPHTWMDPNNVIVWAKNVAAALAAFDPDQAEVYTANADAYILKLQELDAWAAQQTNRLALENRKLVSDHYTLGYFASAYGFEIVGELLDSVSTNAQSSAQELAALEDQIRAFDVPVILVSETVNSTMAEQVAKDTGIKLVQIYSGSLGEPDGPAGTYLDMMRYNVNVIVESLSP